MASDINNNKPMISNTRPQIAMNVNTFGAVLTKAFGSWVETITKEAKPEDRELSVEEIQYSKEKTLMQKAVTERIMKDADPHSRPTFNIVI